MGACPVDAGASVADHDLAPASQRLGHQEQVAHPTALGRIVLPGWPARRHRAGRVDLGEQLAAGLVQAGLRAARIIGPGVDLQHVLHPPAAPRRPALVGCTSAGQPWPELVCCKAWRTVSYDTDSTTWSSTSRSASSRSVQRWWPSGGRCRSARPAGPPAGRPGGGDTDARAAYGRSRPPARPRHTAGGCGPRWPVDLQRAQMAASVHEGPASPWLAFNRIRA
jgi:hypothetical protein